MTTRRSIPVTITLWLGWVRQPLSRSEGWVRWLRQDDAHYQD